MNNLSLSSKYISSSIRGYSENVLVAIDYLGITIVIRLQRLATGYTDKIIMAFVL